MTESLSTPDPPKSRRVREKARLGRPMGFTSWSDEEYIYDNMKNIEKSLKIKSTHMEVWH